MQLRVSLERSSKSVSVGLLEYHHAGTLDCPKPRPGGTVRWMGRWQGDPLMSSFFPESPSLAHFSPRVQD